MQLIFFIYASEYPVNRNLWIGWFEHTTIDVYDTKIEIEHRVLSKMCINDEKA